MSDSPHYMESDAGQSIVHGEIERLKRRVSELEDLHNRDMVLNAQLILERNKATAEASRLRSTMDSITIPFPGSAEDRATRLEAAIRRHIEKLQQAITSLMEDL